MRKEHQMAKDPPGKNQRHETAIRNSSPGSLQKQFKLHIKGDNGILSSTKFGLDLPMSGHLCNSKDWALPFLKWCRLDSLGILEMVETGYLSEENN